MEFSVAEFIQSLSTKSTNTINTYVREVRLFMDWLDSEGTNVDKITRFDVHEYFNVERHRCSQSTYLKKYHAIKSLLSYLDRTDLLDGLYKPSTIPPSKKPQKVIHRDINSLYRKVQGEGKTRDIALIYVAMKTGVRVSEIRQLDRQDVVITDRKGHIVVRHGKGDKKRLIPLSKEARYWLSKYLEERTDTLDALFISQYNQRMSTRSIQRVFEKYGMNPHNARHLFITTLVKKGTPISTIQALSGHRSTAMVVRYTETTFDDMEEAVEALG